MNNKNTTEKQSSKAIFDMDLREQVKKDIGAMLQKDQTWWEVTAITDYILQLITDREKELLERVDKEVIGKEIVPFIDMNPESKQIGYYVELGKHNLQKEQRQKLKVLEGLANLKTK